MGDLDLDNLVQDIFCNFLAECAKFVFSHPLPPRYHDTEVRCLDDEFGDLLPPYCPDFHNGRNVLSVQKVERALAVHKVVEKGEGGMTSFRRRFCDAESFSG